MNDIDISNDIIDISNNIVNDEQIESVAYDYYDYREVIEHQNTIITKLDDICSLNTTFYSFVCYFIGLIIGYLLIFHMLERRK